jgi:5'-nucleotidase
MRILLTNDDGIMAEGIYTLAKELEKEHEVIIIAPEIQRSAQSHAITLFQPLVVKEVKLEGLKSKAYSISGTPADCVRAGLEVLAEGPIDMVFSGINIGLNSGMDILYSGTVSAAIEANIYKIPSIAISAEWVNGNVNFETAAKYAKYILDHSENKLRESNIVLNINTPFMNAEDIKGIKVCKIGGVIYDYYIMEHNEEGEKILKLNGRKEMEAEKDTDRYYLSQGYATVTPLHYDLTNFGLLLEVEGWIKN